MMLPTVWVKGLALIQCFFTNYSKCFATLHTFTYTH